MLSWNSIRRKLLKIEDRAYIVSPKSYPARLVPTAKTIRFVLGRHTLVEVEKSFVQGLSTQQFVQELEIVLSSRFGLNHIAWDLQNIDLAELLQKSES